VNLKFHVAFNQFSEDTRATGPSWDEPSDRVGS